MKKSIEVNYDFLCMLRYAIAESNNFILDGTETGERMSKAGQISLLCNQVVNELNKVIEPFDLESAEDHKELNE